MAGQSFYTRQIIGEQGLTFNELILALSQNEATNDSLYESWKELARVLEISSAEVKKLELDMLLNKMKIMDVVEKLLQLWRQRLADNATLEALIRLVEQIKLNNVATVLRTFQSVLR